jgi:hypothetical protein
LQVVSTLFETPERFERDKEVRPAKHDAAICEFIHLDFSKDYGLEYE